MSSLYHIQFDWLLFNYHQKGFGGAFTEASARNYQSLDDSGKSAVIDLLFGKDGLGYSLGRVHMNSCDFSVESYSFDDVDGEFGLDNFDMDVKHDVRTGMVEMMLDANAVAISDWSEEGAHGMRIMASPWSPLDETTNIRGFQRCIGHDI